MTLRSDLEQALELLTAIPNGRRYPAVHSFATDIETALATTDPISARAGSLQPMARYLADSMTPTPPPATKVVSSRGHNRKAGSR